MVLNYRIASNFLFYKYMNITKARSMLRLEIYKIYFIIKSLLTKATPKKREILMIYKYESIKKLSW